MTDFKAQGKRNKAMGADFERRTRNDLQENGWIVAKWSNNVKFGAVNKEIVETPHSKIKAVKTEWVGRCVPAKPGRFRMMQTGFPDFIAYQETDATVECNVCNHVTNKVPISYIQFVECKCNGILSKEEKEKAQWYLANNYCSKFLVAFKTKIKNRVKVNYKEVQLK